MPLPDKPLIAGSGNPYAFVQRLTAQSTGNFSVPANATALAVPGTPIPIPINTGQGVQLRDTSIAWGDNDSTHHLTVLNVTMILQAPTGPQSIVQRGPGQAINALAPSNLTVAGGGWGTTDWPFVAWNDFIAQFAITPNMNLQPLIVVTNNDAAAHSVVIQLSAIWEMWQASNLQKVGHAGYQA